MRLSNVKKGDQVTIVEIDADLQTQQELFSLGILPGDTLQVISSGFLGGPLALRHEQNTFFALRREYAGNILVQVNE